MITLSRNSFLKTYKSHSLHIFILFGTLVLALTLATNEIGHSSSQAQLTSREWQLERENTLRILRTTVQHTRGSAISLAESTPLDHWLHDPSPQNLHVLESLFLTITRENKTYMQVRFLDSTGMERLRVERKAVGSAPVLVAEGRLQDKGDRYYFKNTIPLKAGEISLSRLDLNVEHGQIEAPFRPTLRLSTPVYLAGRSQGVVIINLFASRLLEDLLPSNNFNISLVEEDGSCLYSADPDRSWARARRTGCNVLEEQAGKLDFTAHTSSWKQQLYQSDISSEFPTGQGIRLVFEKKQPSDSERLHYWLRLFKVFVTVALLCLPAAMLLSHCCRQMLLKLEGSDTRQQAWAEIVQDHVMYLTVDADRRVVGAGAAFLRNTGFTAEELVGRLWDAILQDHTEAPALNETVREMELRNATGGSFWADCSLHPAPELSEENRLWIMIIRDISIRKQVEQRSLTDRLTGLANRAGIDNCLTVRQDFSDRYNHGFTVIMFDLDHFKKINDTLGHQAGDAVLTEIGELLKDHVRRSDLAGRFGGEEFMVVLPNTDVDGAASMAENLRLQIQMHHFSPGCPVTASFGVTAYRPEENLEQLVERADRALYQAKNSGRNRVCKR